MALDIGPIGRLLKPYGDFEFEEAVKVFAKTVQLELLPEQISCFIETMNDSYDTKAALCLLQKRTAVFLFLCQMHTEVTANL